LLFNAGKIDKIFYQIANRGLKLSGGGKQRLSLARLFLKNLKSVSLMKVRLL
jgi:ABC-type transport system involved in Fe-S cluster assembly fused permease/ATPase subunit